MNTAPYEYTQAGVAMEVPVNIYLKYIKYFSLLWEEHTTTFTALHQIEENKDFLNELDKEGYSSFTLGFLLLIGCPSIKVKVVEPLLFYK